MTPNPLRGEFSATIGGVPSAFDTTLGTIARIEEACGGRSILDVVNGVVIGRRAADQMTLLSAALQATGQPPAEAEAIAARATVPEAEAFILALMGALGFKLTPRAGEAGEQGPLDGSSAGDAGASSPSAA
ncbi:GTA-gp10 family protein [Lichenifustis flavocetrariae]|uniref:GTA-gp10 family protein n=1 Tax=Lichenifustis flavocetrariae TaxID=2949735 RepID=A0AA41YYM0_9HYPH|nr:GTA-gp10 family protein [Lichenifustis flavocetrariae]MCW6510986.1 GTA-gp10 family protein [Lichenifustis flavocetrariae]